MVFRSFANLLRCSGELIFMQSRRKRERKRERERDLAFFFLTKRRHFDWKSTWNAVWYIQFILIRYFTFSYYFTSFFFYFEKTFVLLSSIVYAQAEYLRRRIFGWSLMQKFDWNKFQCACKFSSNNWTKVDLYFVLTKYFRKTWRHLTLGNESFNNISYMFYQNVFLYFSNEFCSRAKVKRWEISCISYADYWRFRRWEKEQ